MICPNCGTQSPTDDCINCGVIISKHIAITGKSNEPGAKRKKKFEIYVEEKPSPAKAIILNILFLLTCLIVYIVACPFITVNDLKKAVEQRDAEKMAQYINYETLRESFKKQFDTKIIESTGKAGGNPVASLAAAYVSKITDPMVEEAVTTESLAKMMTGYKKFKNKGPDIADLGPTEEKAISGIFLEARSNYDSLNEFSIIVLTEKGNETQIVMKRTGIFSWKVNNIVMAAE